MKWEICLSFSFARCSTQCDIWLCFSADLVRFIMLAQFFSFLVVSFLVTSFFFFLLDFYIFVLFLLVHLSEGGNREGRKRGQPISVELGIPRKNVRMWKC